MIDVYFRRPLIWDYTLSFVITAITFRLYQINVVFFPKEEYIWSMDSDLSTISLTLAGFILTLVTVLITFKSASKIKKNSDLEDESIFNVFFATSLYFETVRHLKNCIRSLVCVSVLGYLLKLFLNNCDNQYIYFFDVFGVIIIALTIWRTLLILTKIINLQKQE